MKTKSWTGDSTSTYGYNHEQDRFGNAGKHETKFIDKGYPLCSVNKQLCHAPVWEQRSIPTMQSKAYPDMIKALLER